MENRRTFLKRTAALTATGITAGLAGCERAAPNELQTTARTEIEIGPQSTYIEVSGEVWPSSGGGLMPDTVEILVELLLDGRPAASNKEMLNAEGSSSAEYSVTFRAPDDMSANTVDARTTALQAWDNGEILTPDPSASTTVESEGEWS